MGRYRAGIVNGPRDRDQRNIIHVGDTVSVLSPASTPDHDGVGDVTVIDGDVIGIKDTAGRIWAARAHDVSVDWTDYPPGD